MCIQKNHKFFRRILSQRGGGIAIVAFGVVVMLVFIFTAMNILNSKMIEQGYNNLRDSVMSASTGSVIHLLLDVDEDNIDENQLGVKPQNTNITYDPYLQLALGYIINYENISNPNTNSAVIGVEKNNFIKLDHKKVINSTLQLISDTVLNGDSIHNFNKYQIFMFFIEPNYNNAYKKSFNLIWYTNDNCISGSSDPYNGTVVTIDGDSMEEMYVDLETKISNAVNSKGNMSKKYHINLNADADVSNEELIRRMETRPYYLIVVKDFALPTIFGNNSTTQSNGIIKSLFGQDGTLSQPMCALQAGKIERRLSN